MKRSKLTGLFSAILAVAVVEGEVIVGNARAEQGKVAAGTTAVEKATAPALEFDAKFVRMEVPKKLITDEVFAAKVVMKNTGTKAWTEQDATFTVLISQDPAYNKTWGTDFWIQGQGRPVHPGAEFEYSSNLKAPAKPGQYSFQWRVRKFNSGDYYGEPTAKEIITVEQREEPVAPPAALPPPSDGKRVMTSEDFEYAGSFRVPCNTW